MSVLKNWKIYRRRGKHRTFAFTMACARRVIEADNLIWLNKYNSWLQELFFGNTLWRHTLGIIEAETVMKKGAILINTKEFIQLSVTAIPHIESATRWIRESMTKTAAEKNIFGRQKFKLMNSPVLLSSAPGYYL